MTVLAVVQPAVEALPGNYDFVQLVPVLLLSVVFPWAAIEAAYRWLWMATAMRDDDGDERVGGS